MERTRSVLIVEDNADQAATLKELLSLKGHRLEIASTGPAAIERARRQRPEVVLLEVHLVKPADPGFIESLLG